MGLHNLLLSPPTYHSLGVTKYSTDVCLIVSLHHTALRGPISLYVQCFILGNNIKSCRGQTLCKCKYYQVPVQTGGDYMLIKCCIFPQCMIPSDNTQLYLPGGILYTKIG